MDELESIKSAASPAARRHPEDVDSDDYSDQEDSHLNHEDGKDEDGDDDDPEDIEISAEGLSRNMPSFKHTSKLSLSGSFQTGVKGVLADAVSFESARRRERTARASPGQYAGYTEPAMAVSPPKRRESDGESGSDDDFVKVWRKNRLAELKTGVATTRRQSPSKRKYGRVEAVDAAGYLDAVERVSSETIVVVTIYNDSSSESQFVEDCFNTLARRYLTTRFVKLHYREAEFDPEVVPAVLAYKGGELFANLVKIVDEIPPGRGLSTDSLELVLRRYDSRRQ
ncbi:thioredoxin-like protein [Morchella snyderi]|nr:thioredoxin-like protein [Morchella snyderi]